jgi:hypothetical protein
MERALVKSIDDENAIFEILKNMVPESTVSPFLNNGEKQSG